MALEISRPRASGLLSPLASSIGPSPKNSVRPVPANVSTVVPSLSFVVVNVPVPRIVTTPPMLSSRSEIETENVLPSDSPKWTETSLPATLTVLSTAAPVVLTRKRTRPPIWTPPVTIAALPERKPATPLLWRTRTPVPSVTCVGRCRR